MIFRNTLRAFLPAALALALAAGAGGCAYKIEIKQGSDQLLESADQLQLGMSKDEVRALLGPPPVPRLFKKNIWIYTYQLRDSGFIGRQQMRSIKLSFDDSGALTQVDILHDDYRDDSEEAEDDSDN